MYKMIELTKEQKEYLANSEALNPEGDAEFDIDCKWYITNNPNYDNILDGRIVDELGRATVWMENGNRYPFEYILLIGGNDPSNYYDSLTIHAIEDLNSLVSEFIDFNGWDDRNLAKEYVNKFADKNYWYVLRYDVETSKYYNEIVFTTLGSALRIFNETRVEHTNERIELMFSHEDESYDNTVISWKTFNE